MIEIEILGTRGVRHLLDLPSGGLGHITDFGAMGRLETMVLVFGFLPTFYAGMIGVLLGLCLASSRSDWAYENHAETILAAAWAALGSADPVESSPAESFSVEPSPVDPVPAELIRVARSDVWNQIWRDWRVAGAETGGERPPVIISREQLNPAGAPQSVAGYAWRQRQESLILGDRGRDALAGLIAARRAAAWIPYGALVIICEPPWELHTELVDGGPRLHREAGPAVVWSDDPRDRDHYRHGTEVTAD